MRISAIFCTFFYPFLLTIFFLCSCLPLFLSFIIYSVNYTYTVGENFATTRVFVGARPAQYPDRRVICYKKWCYNGGRTREYVLWQNFPVDLDRRAIFPKLPKNRTRHSVHPVSFLLVRLSVSQCHAGNCYEPCRCSKVSRR